MKGLIRFIATWHRVQRHKVPKWVRGKLHKTKYVVDKNREYKKNVTRMNGVKTNGLHTGDQHYEQYGPTSWKEVKYYYRKLK